MMPTQFRVQHSNNNVFSVWILIILIIFVIGCNTFANKTDLPVIWLGSYFSSGPDWLDGIECYPAVQIAVTEINNNPDLLPSYQLGLIMNDSKCNALEAVRSQLYQMSHFPITGIIGAGCSVESIPIALYGGCLQIPQISYSSTSPELSNKLLYPYFMRVVPTDTIQALCWVSILNHYGWKRFSTLNSQESVHSLLVSEFLGTVSTNPDLQVLTSESFPGSQNADMTEQISNIKMKGTTIIFVACYGVDAVNIFKIAHSLGMTGEEYVWIGTDSWIDESLLNVTNPDWIQGVIGSNPASGNSNQTTAFHLKYQMLTGKLPNTYTVYTEFSYDAVYAMAKGLHQVIEIDNYPYDPMNPSPDFGYELLTCIKNLSFVGITAGKVVFDKNGDRLLPYEIFDYQGSSMVKVAFWDPLNDLYLEYTPVLWANGLSTVPMDSLQIYMFTLNVVLKNIFLFQTFLSMAITVIFMIGVWYWREHVRIKAATRLFLVIILVAALFAYSVNIIIYIEPVNDFTCIIPHWFGHLSFFVSFGCLFAKTFRVWQIFSLNDNLAKSTSHMSDFMLLLFVLGFSTVGIIFLVVFTILDRPVPTYRYDDSNDIMYLECRSQNWILLGLFLFEFLSLFFGVYLSFKTRKIELLRYNESSQIAISIYTQVFIGFIFIPMAYFLQSNLSPDLSFLITAGGILMGTSTLVGVLFIPKFRAILNNKPDEKGVGGVGVVTSRFNSRSGTPLSTRSGSPVTARGALPTARSLMSEDVLPAKE